VSDTIPSMLGRRRLTLWVLVGAAILLGIMSGVALLWLVMPDWFKEIILEHSPRLEWAYRAAERSGGNGNLEVRLHDRFSRQAVLRVANERLKSGTPAEQEFAARHIGWIYWQNRREPRFVLDDEVLKQDLVAGLLAVSKRGNAGSTDAACYALLQMGEVQFLPDLLKILDHQRDRFHSLLLFRSQRMIDPLITTHLLEWFRATRDHTVFDAIIAQKDPRTEALMIAVLTSSLPGTSNLRRNALRADCRSSEFFAAVRKLCADSDYNLRHEAGDVLGANANGLDWMLDVRVDPVAWQSHPFAEATLWSRADELSIDQGYRWITAPPLEVDKVR
jgi:hypothetical protein